MVLVGGLLVRKWIMIVQVNFSVNCNTIGRGPCEKVGYDCSGELGVMLWGGAVLKSLPQLYR